MNESDSSMNRTSLLLIITALLGVTAVATGAIGAHALRETLEAGGYRESWATAVHYHLIHSVGLLALVLATRDRLFGTAIFWIAGVLLFSGSIYALCLGGPKWLGPITPIGGVLMILGWLTLLLPKSRRKLFNATV